MNHRDAGLRDIVRQQVAVQAAQSTGFMLFATAILSTLKRTADFDVEHFEEVLREGMKTLAEGSAKSRSPISFDHLEHIVETLVEIANNTADA